VLSCRQTGKTKRRYRSGRAKTIYLQWV